MKKLNVTDLASIQDCLDCYKNLIKAMPVTCKEEELMRDGRIETIYYLIGKCETIIRGIANENNR